MYAFYIIYCPEEDLECRQQGREVPQQLLFFISDFVGRICKLILAFEESINCFYKLLQG